MDLIQKLEKQLNNFESDGFFSGEKIPTSKLKNAISYFPIDKNRKVLALIDSTVFGSCKNGLAFTEKGLIWKNDWTTKSKKTSLSWEELLKTKKTMKLDTHGLIFSDNVIFNMAGCQMKKPELFNLFHSIIDQVEETKGKYLESSTQLQDEDLEKKKESKKATNHKFLNDSAYNEIVSEIVAASIVADGEVEESEIEMAVLMIENDDLIIDKKGTLENLHINIENYLSQISKSTAVFKLKITTVAHKLKDIEDILKKEMLITILDNMYDSVKNNDKSKTKTVIEKFKFILKSKTSNPSKEAAIENFILRSGDKDAINEYEKIKRNPSNFGRNLQNAAKGNSVLRTAFGVFTGVIAANLIMDSIHQYQLQQALTNFDSQLKDIGGIDNLNMPDGDISDVDFSQGLDPVQEASISDFDGDDIDSFNDIEPDLGGVELADSGVLDVDPTESLDVDLDVGSDFGDFFDIFG